MKYNARKFSQNSYDINDSYAKDKITPFLIKRGHTILKDEEDYNHDLVTLKEGKKYYFEFEIKRNYPFTNRKSYNFPSVSFLGRKKRLHDIQPFLYLILCYETDAIVYSSSNIIFNDEYKQILNLNQHDRKGMDEMYRVPLNKCLFNKI